MNRRDSAAKSLANLLDDSVGPLKVLLDRLALLEGMDHTLAPFLAASLRAKVRVTHVTHDTLDLSCADAYTATRVRYLVPELLDHLHREGLPQLREIRVNVKPF